MYSTQGVVLKKYDVGEADAILTLYTRDYGKIRAFAQGVKKEGAKLKGHLEPFSLSEIGLVPGKTGERLTHAELLHYGSSTRADFAKMQAACFVVSAYDRNCFEGERDERLWELLKGALLGIEKAEPSEIKGLLADFEKHFFAVLGFSETDRGGDRAVLLTS